METKKLYYDNCYAKEFEARVLSCRQEKDKYYIELDETLFYPEGGGQPADRGLLSGLPVLDVQEKDDIVIHVLSEPLEVGQKVFGSIDWDYRYDLMRQHTAEHILSGIVHELFGYDNVGFRMGEEVLTLDFNGKLTANEVLHLESLANKIAAGNKELAVTFPDKAALERLDYRSKKALSGDIRIVEVPGADVCACCGIHVARTGEVGLIKIVDLESHKGGVRLSMIAGDRALLDYNEKCENIRQISQALSVPPKACGKAVLDLKEKLSALQWKNTQLVREIFGNKLFELLEGAQKAVFFEEAMDTKELRYFVNMAVSKVSDFAVIFSGDDKGGYSFMIASKSGGAREQAALLQEAFGCKAGGTTELVQGKAMAKEEDLRAFFE